MDTLGDRILKCRTEAKLRQEDFADRMGVDRVTANHWEKDKKQANHQNLIKMAELFDVSLDWLLRGKEQPQPVKQTRVTKSEHRIRFTTLELTPYPEMHELKVVEGRAAADFNPTFSQAKETIWVDKRFSSDKHYGIVVHGNSMASTICEGDIAIIRKQGWLLEEFDPERGAALKHEWKRLDKKIILASVNGEEPLCKRIRVQDIPDLKTGFFIQLCSDNCESPPIPIWRNQKLEVLGIVVAAVRVFEK